MATILDEILTQKRREVAAAMRAVSFPRVEEAALASASGGPARSFAAALRPATTGGTPRLIAEIKKRSPTKGSLAPTLDVPAMARLYADNGAAAISVLTDERFFEGSLDDLRAARAQVPIPVLRKDFVISPYQLFEARAAGADAALLIVAALASPLADTTYLDEVQRAKGKGQSEGTGDSLFGLGVDAGVKPGELDLGAAAERLGSLLAVAERVGLACLVEVHDEAELAVALAAGSRIVGVNNRDLRTFETRLDVTERLAPRVPRDVILVAESGITTREDVERLRRAGAAAILVGSAIVGAPDPAAKVRKLAGR